MNRYTETQLGKKKIRELGSQTKATYALYVDQGSQHEPVLVGVEWQAGKDKTKELIDNGVSPLDIYGSALVESGCTGGFSVLGIPSAPTVYAMMMSTSVGLCRMYFPVNSGVALSAEV